MVGACCAISWTRRPRKWQPSARASPPKGLGAQLLARQQADGVWRKGNDDAPVWYATLHSLLLLRATGVDRADPRVVAALRRLVDHFRWAEELGGQSFFAGEHEPCINGGVLALGSYFDHAYSALVDLLILDQLPDGGWNCDAPTSQCSSFHSTICVLEGLLAFQRLGRSSPSVVAARHRGEEYLLARGLFRRRSTGAPIDALTTLSFPTL